MAAVSPVSIPHVLGVYVSFRPGLSSVVQRDSRDMDDRELQVTAMDLNHRVDRGKVLTRRIEKSL